MAQKFSWQKEKLEGFEPKFSLFYICLPCQNWAVLKYFRIQQRIYVCFRTLKSWFCYLYQLKRNPHHLGHLVPGVWQPDTVFHLTHPIRYLKNNSAEMGWMMQWIRFCRIQTFKLVHSNLFHLLILTMQVKSWIELITCWILGKIMFLNPQKNADTIFLIHFEAKYWFLPFPVSNCRG